MAAPLQCCHPQGLWVNQVALNWPDNLRACVDHCVPALQIGCPLPSLSVAYSIWKLHRDTIAHVSVRDYFLSWRKHQYGFGLEAVLWDHNRCSWIVFSFERRKFLPLWIITQDLRILSHVYRKDTLLCTHCITSFRYISSPCNAFIACYNYMLQDV